MADAHLFSPITFRGLTIKNRIGVSPMCQYSSVDGFANDWHLIHIGSRAVGGAGLIIMEATAVTPEGRITPNCLGIWQDAHIEKLKQITDFAKSQGAVIGIQLAHAGRKASMARPWDGGKVVEAANGGWQPLAPSPIPFDATHQAPHEMTQADITKFIADFVAAARRAVTAGFQVLEIHGAHGYLLHEFLSPLSNKRTDQYGGSEENRFRLFVDTAKALRAAVPESIVLAARLSCSDWDDAGVTIDMSVRLSATLKNEGVDFIDCSSGAILPDIKIPTGPHYQVPFARDIRAKAAIPTAAVGMITEATAANEVIETGEADMVFLARALLHDPYWPLHAAETLKASADILPAQYTRGFDTRKFAKAS